MSSSLYIAYGSESGNAHTLSYHFKNSLLALAPHYSELNELNLSELSSTDTLLIITSTTGDGDAPSNAKQFYRKLIESKNTLAFNFAVFGLGDTKYDSFCGFSIVIDAMLRQKGANPIANRVDADIDFEAFFDIWSDAIKAFLRDEPNAAETLKDLTLQVKP